MSLNLLEKTELWINNIVLREANLTEMANAVAEVLGLPPGKVMVVDVRDRHITFDLLVREIPQKNILGQQEMLLKRLSELHGVELTKDTYIHSNGILGLLCAGVEDPETMLARIEAMSEEIQQKVAKRAIVFPTGFEISKGMIQDTNTPFLIQELERAGFCATKGRVIQDSPEDLVFHLSDALDRGFGLVLTTGGVGAEDKDYTVEAIQQQDPDAAISYIVKFQEGTGRHVKDGVRIAVGKSGASLLVCLPGPHDEVRLAAPVLIKGLVEGWDKKQLAHSLADRIGTKYKRAEYHH